MLFSSIEPTWRSPADSVSPSEGGLSSSQNAQPTPGAARTCLGASVPGPTPDQRNRATWSILACLSHKGTQLMFLQRVPSRTEPHLPAAGIYQLSDALFFALGFFL